MNPLWKFKLVKLASICVLLAVAPIFAQQAPAPVFPQAAVPVLARTECPQTPLAGAAIKDARVAGEAQMAQPQSGGGAGRGEAIYSMQARKPSRTLASARVQTVCVPDFRGMTLDQAKAAIEKAKGLHLESATPPNGVTVTAQNPAPFRYVPVGTGVTLQLKPPEVASHLRKVPDITRVDVSLLPAFLERAGLAYGGSQKQETNKYPAGAIFQDPLAGKMVEEGTRVFRYEATAPPAAQQYQLTLTASATDLTTNEQVSFEATITPAVKGAGYQFDFADDEQTDLQGENTAQHQYARDGTFTVKAKAVLPGGETEPLHANVTVQVHAISWTVTLEPSAWSADTNTPIVFEARLLPANPLPEQAEYLFYFDKDKKAVNSNKPSVKWSFANAGQHFASVVVKDADGHSFKSDIETVFIVEPPPQVWLWVLSTVAAGAISWLGGLKIAQKIATGRLQYALVADTPGTQSVEQPSGSAVEAGVEFQVVHPPLDASAQCAGPIIKRVERLV